MCQNQLRGAFPQCLPMTSPNAHLPLGSPTDARRSSGHQCWGDPRPRRDNSGRGAAAPDRPSSAVLARQTAAFGRYPGNAGTDGFRQAVAGWLGRRYRLPRAIDPMSEILVLAGSREGLFLSAIAAKRFVGPRPVKPAILVPNPFYAPYSAGAIAADCEPVYLDATAATGFLPDLDALSPELLARTVASISRRPPSAGSVASRASRRVAALARSTIHAVRGRGYSEASGR